MQFLPVFLSFLLVSCATTQGKENAILARAEFDLNCTKAQLTVRLLQSSLAQSTYGVTGCDQRTTYIVSGDSVNGYTVLANFPKVEK